MLDIVQWYTIITSSMEATICVLGKPTFMSVFAVNYLPMLQFVSSSGARESGL